MTRKRRPHDGEPEVHTNQWVLKLERASGGVGYFALVGPDGIRVRRELGGMVQRFRSRKQAERCARWLHEHHDLDIEEATPKEIVYESTYALWIGDGRSPNGISVDRDEQTGTPYLLVRHDGEETSSDLDVEAADLLVRVLDELNRRLRPK